MSEYHWDRFTLRIPIKADKAMIYRAWTTQQGLEKWFLRSAVFTNSEGQKRIRTAYIHTPDTYEWLWHGYPDEVLEKGEILEANGTDLLAFTFSGGCQVQIKIYTEQDMSICELFQTKIPTTERGKKEYHLGCMSGWNFYLTNLKSVLEGGLDLRNKNDKIISVINA